jgi:outer membrane lipoprotein-sorting protein
MNCAECKDLLVQYLEGSLKQNRQQLVLAHLQICRLCQKELAEITSLHNRLTENGKNIAQSDLENNVIDRIVREQSLQLRKVNKQIRLWSTIMKSRMTKLAVAAAIIIALFVGVTTFLGGTVTFAKVIEPILNARTVILDIVIGDEQTSPLMHEIVVGPRIRRTISNIENITQIIDPDSAKMLALDTEAKTATYIDIKGPLQERTKNYVEFLRQVIIDLKDGPNVKELGEKQINGQKTVGFVAKGPNQEVAIWADSKTALPIRAELRVGTFFAVLKNFKFDVPIENSLVSMDVPQGYTLQKTEIDLSAVSEQDFIESLRIWAEILLDGSFPETIGTENSMKQIPLLTQKLTKSNLPDDKTTQMMMKFVRGMLFLQIFETEGKWQYVGKGVKLGDADNPIFWYQPKDSETYRVIYGDLSVNVLPPENLPK